MSSLQERRAKESKQETDQNKLKKNFNVSLVSDGMHCKLKVQNNEISHTKVIGIRSSAGKNNSVVNFSLHLEDF